MRAAGAISVGKLLQFMLGLGIAMLPLAFIDRSVADVRVDRSKFDYNAPPHLSQQHVFRIVAFGSSSTFGTGASSASLTYPARLARLLADQKDARESVDVVNRGVGGEDIRDMAKRLSSDIASRRADLVIWQTGSNDALRHVPIDRYERILREGIADLRRSGSEVMLMEPQWCPKLEEANAVAPYIAVLRRVARETNAALIPRYEIMKRWIASGVASVDDLIGPDHIHSTDRGYGLLAEAVRDEVLQHSDAYRRLVSGASAATAGPSPLPTSSRHDGHS